MGSGSSPRPAGGQMTVGPSFVGRTGLDDANHVHVHVPCVVCACRVARVPCYRPSSHASRVAEPEGRAMRMDPGGDCKG